MYTMTRPITYSQVGSDLHIDMAELVHLFQDCALFQAESIGKGPLEVSKIKKGWFLLSWQVEVMQYPAFGDEVTVRTWPYAFKGMYGYRNFDLLDREGNRIVIANSVWTFMDIEKLRPIRPDKEDLQGYDMKPPLSMDCAPRKIKLWPEEDFIMRDDPILVKRSFLDSNRHVNNGRYVAEAMNYMPEERRMDSMRVDYRKAAVLGSQMYPVIYEKPDGSGRQIVFADEEKKPYVIVEVMFS